MNEEQQERKYLKRMLHFYFRTRWESFFTILYFVFFSYFAIFHSGKLFVALKFLFYTFVQSPGLLELPFLFWGVVFIISLIIPFSISLYAIFLLYEVWESNWEYTRKLLFTALLITAIPLLIIAMDEIIRFVAGQGVLSEFIFINKLQI